ncbi:MAG TPA: hypothetical protein VF950_20455 [Planctomycetota bacterium]
MEFERDGSLERAEEFFQELEEDRRTAPPEFVPLVETYLPRLGESIHRFKERRIGERELDAHIAQIRISYARDLQRLLPGEKPPTARFTRT